MAYEKRAEAGLKHFKRLMAMAARKADGDWEMEERYMKKRLKKGVDIGVYDANVKALLCEWYINDNEDVSDAVFDATCRVFYDDSVRYCQVAQQHVQAFLKDGTVAKGMCGSILGLFYQYYE